LVKSYGINQKNNAPQLKKLLYILLFLNLSRELGTICNLHSQSITWQRVFGGPGNDFGYAVTQTLDGGYAFVGLSDNTANFYKIDSLGNEEWRKNYVFSGPGLTSLNNIIQLSDGSYIIGGTKLSSERIVLIKTNNQGDTLWTKMYSYNGLDSRLSSMKLLSDSGFIMCGEVLFASPPGLRAYVIRVDSNGNLLWQNVYMDSTHNSVQDIVQDNSGNYYYSSSTWNNGGRSYGLITKLSNTGEKLWSKFILNNSNYLVGGAENILIEGNNTLVVKGGYDTLLTGINFIGKFDTAGNRISMNSYFLGVNMMDMHKALNGDYIFTGLGGPPNYDVPFYRINVAGSKAFMVFINSSGNELDNGFGINGTNDNGSIIVGSTSFGVLTDALSGFEGNILVIKTDSSGYAPPVKIVPVSSIIPEEFKVRQNYPNPFNPTTVIQFSLKKSAYVRLIAYDITGREVQKMVDNKLQAGEYEVDFMGKFTASGVYLYSLIVDGQTIAAKKMLLVK